jgi:transposase-like protein
MSFANSSWNGGTDRPRQTGAATVPTQCPACQSNAITTTARNPDEHSYWRCSGCGEVWNASRRHDRLRVGYRWP